MSDTPLRVLQFNYQQHQHGVFQFIEFGLKNLDVCFVMQKCGSITAVIGFNFGFIWKKNNFSILVHVWVDEVSKKGVGGEVWTCVWDWESSTLSPAI